MNRSQKEEMLSRRQFLRLLAVGAGGSLLAACGGANPSAEAPTGGAAPATSAPAATAAPAATSAPAATAAPAASGGAVKLTVKYHQNEQ
jgi:hypothetical protein